MKDVEAIPALENVLHDMSLHPNAAEALGAIGLRSNISLLENSLVRDPTQEVRETCELALSRIEELPTGSECIDSIIIGASPFLSVDPATSSTGSFVHQLREVLLNEDKKMYERYSALFGLRNHGGDEAILLSSKL